MMIQRITQLEERLFKDSQGIYRTQLISQLNAEKTRLDTFLQSSRAADQSREMVLQCAAIEYAQAVIEAIWDIYHIQAREWNA